MLLRPVLLPWNDEQMSVHMHTCALLIYMHATQSSGGSEQLDNLQHQSAQSRKP